MERVPDFFKGKNVFLTGATGYLGKVLIEKLLRSCPEVGNLYLLIRAKKGKGLHERIKDITDKEVFDLLKKEHPENLKKIIPINGDCMELGLGLSESDRQMLEENVHIVYHGAASVRFDDELGKAILLNTRGTREMITLVKNMKHIKVFVHVSTAYCNCDKIVVEEKLYPAPADWRKYIEMVETTDRHLLNTLTSKVLGLFPNTYVFSKALSEHVVNDLVGDIPTVIARPTIVFHALKEPMPGWIDNFYGPMGIYVAEGIGILRAHYFPPEVVLDLVPVDIVIKVLLVAAWHKAKSGVTTVPSVYHIGGWRFLTLSHQYFKNFSEKMYSQYPYGKLFWVPHIESYECWIFYYVEMIRCQLIPALVVDGILKMMGKKQILCKLQRKIYYACAALEIFTFNEWIFYNNNMVELDKQLASSDVEAFSIKDLYSVNDEQYVKDGLLGTKRYLLHEKDDFEASRRNFKRMYWLDKIVTSSYKALGLWWLYRSEILPNIFFKVVNNVNDYWSEL